MGDGSRERLELKQDSELRVAARLFADDLRV